MQTFLPYENFEESAKCLDFRRLGKQRVEALQILNVITGKSNSNAWKNHPAVKMWEGYSYLLSLYMNTMIDEWERRGYKNTMQRMFVISKDIIDPFPKWLGNKAFHDSHKSNLLRKDPKYYSKFGWDVPDNLEYVWPTKIMGA